MLKFVGVRIRFDSIRFDSQIGLLFGIPSVKTTVHARVISSNLYSLDPYKPVPRVVCAGAGWYKWRHSHVRWFYPTMTQAQRGLGRDPFGSLKFFWPGSINASHWMASQTEYTGERGGEFLHSAEKAAKHSALFSCSLPPQVVPVRQPKIHALTISSLASQCKSTEISAPRHDLEKLKKL